MTETNILLLAAVAVLLIVMIITIFVLRSSQKRNEDYLQSLAKELSAQKERENQRDLSLLNGMADVKLSLNKEFIDFSSRINRDFDDLNERTTDRLLQMEGRIRSNLEDSREKSDTVYRDIIERMTRIDEAQKEYSSLSREISSLQNILQDKKTRGIFGEVELYHLLESVLGEEGILFKKQCRLSNGTMVDALILAGEKIGNICIDSKFPLENYRRMVDEDLEKAQRENARKAFEADVRKHISDIRDKYIIKGETAEMAFLFLPAEAIYSEILSHFDKVVDYAYRSKVFLVSPTTLLAYLTAVKNIYIGLKKDEKAEEIRGLLQNLSRDFDLFKKRSDNLYKHFQELTDDFHDFEVTSGKIQKRFHTIYDGDLHEQDL